MTVSMSDSLSPHRRFSGMTRNFPTSHFRKSTSLMATPLPAAYKSSANLLPVKRPSRSVAPSPASFTLTFKSDEPLHETQLAIPFPPVLPFSSLPPWHSSFLRRTHPPLAPVHLRRISQRYGPWSRRTQRRPPRTRT